MRLCKTAFSSARSNLQSTAPCSGMRMVHHPSTTTSSRTPPPLPPRLLTAISLPGPFAFTAPLLSPPPLPSPLLPSPPPLEEEEVMAKSPLANKSSAYFPTKVTSWRYGFEVTTQRWKHRKFGTRAAEGTKRGCAKRCKLPKFTLPGCKNTGDFRLSTMATLRFRLAVWEPVVWSTHTTRATRGHNPAHTTHRTNSNSSSWLLLLLLLLAYAGACCLCPLAAAAVVAAAVDVAAAAAVSGAFAAFSPAAAHSA
mmetsp:Transcript_82980/g.165989  ORF Transcript_82980/g.165989 Transcript_82980/m.165989 type:complete len:253 (+) Transcript_82980:441-1199(+)